MSDVRILPEIISNRIAAGEVVERPVSIVKELVENSLDAGATKITIEIKMGGRDLVRVSDDGEGMTRDNALLAIERYATSKIFSNDDLFSIKSFGFRGEALPSIASVSRFTLVTRDRSSDSGTKIFIKGGKIINVSEIGAPFGTEIEVKNLFFNIPVRRKFLKSVNTEMGHIGDVVSGMALGNPGVGFRLFHNSRLIRSFLPADDILKRTEDVLGREIVKDFYHVFAEDRDIRINGYISRPSLTRSSPRNIRLFVNNRMISDNGLVSAIFRGFRGRIIKGKFPMAVLFINLPYDQVDVNVHPSKLQVRFANKNQLYLMVVQAVSRALKFPEIESLPVPDGRRFQFEKISVIHRAESGGTVTKYDIEDVTDALDSTDSTDSTDSDCTASDFKSDKTFKTNCIEFLNYADLQKIEKRERSEKKKIAESVFQWSNEDNVEVPAEKQVPEKISVKQFNKPCYHVAGQVFGTYIVAESGEDMVLIDQHAAHERIVYEKMKKRVESFTPPSQQLAVPEVLELGFREADLLDKITDDLLKLGIVIEPFGGTSFIVKSVPAIIDDKEISPFIREMLDNILESGTDTGDDYHKQKWLDDVIITMACHSAIRANYSLSLREQEKLLFDLEKCKNPNNCPHGRPTKIKWSKTKIEKMFKRIV